MTATQRLPRVLIITPGVLNPFKSSGVTLSRLFAEWPRECIAQIHSDVYPEDPSLASRYYATGGPYRRTGRIGMRRAAQFAAFALGQAEHGLVWSRMSGRLRRWLREYRPEVILSETGNLSFVHLTHEVMDETGAPLVLHIPDDWVSEWPSNALGRSVPVVGPRLAGLARREFARLVERASGLTAISEAMAEVYQQRYGRPWEVVVNGADLEAWPPVAPSVGPFTAARPFTLLYSGSLTGPTQFDGVRSLAEAVASLASEGHPVRFEVATHPVFRHRASELPSSPAVAFVEQVPAERLPQRFAQADTLYLPGTFDPHYLRYGRLSMPGKVAEYLPSSRPVLVSGHPSLAWVQHAERHGWGEVVATPGIGPMREAVLRLASDDARRAALVARAREVAEQEFSIDVMRGRLRDALVQAVAS